MAKETEPRNPSLEASTFADCQRTAGSLPNEIDGIVIHPDHNKDKELLLPNISSSEQQPSKHTNSMTRGLNPPNTLSAENVHTLRSVRRDIYYQGIIGGGKLEETERMILKNKTKNIVLGSFRVCRRWQSNFHSELCSHKDVRSLLLLFVLEIWHIF